MEVLVGRQPILNRQGRTVAYELLFRSSATVNSFDGRDGTEATATVITNSFMSAGCDRVLGSRSGFINFTRRLLVEDAALVLPNSKVVIEVLENIEPDGEVVEACRRLKEAGYRLALDDIVASGDQFPLQRLADYIKVDFRGMNSSDRRQVCDFFRKQGYAVLAEKVESQAEFDQAVQDGCELFQGYFFARPEMIASRQVAPSKLNCMRLIGEAQKPELDFARMEKLHRGDVGLVQRLLVFVNSAAFAVRGKIQSINQAFICLGEQNVRKWITLGAIPTLAAGKPEELVTESLVRARFCELAAEDAGLGDRSDECFLMGLLSLLDVMIGRPLGELLQELAVDEEIAGTLAGGDQAHTGLQSLLNLAVALERSDLEGAAELARPAGLDLGTVSEYHVQAMEWADSVLPGA